MIVDWYLYKIIDDTKLHLIYKESQSFQKTFSYLPYLILIQSYLSQAQYNILNYFNVDCNSIPTYSIYSIILNSQFQSMMTQEELMNYYQKEYDSTEYTIEQLKKQQREMINILTQMNKKVNKQVEKKYVRMNGNQGKSKWSKNSSPKKLRSVRNSRPQNSDKQNLTLPSIVAESQLKNSQKYHKILTNQSNKLEKRLQQHQNEKTITNRISQQTSKIATMRKNNKSIEIQISKISKNAEEIIMEPNYRGYQAVYEQLLAEVENKRAQNSEKAKIIERNSQKVYKCQQQLMGMEAKLDEINGEGQGEQSRVKQAMDLSSKVEYLKKKKQKIAINLNSLDKRLSQQYYSKLKQLQSQTEKTTELEHKYQQLCAKIQQAQQTHSEISKQSPPTAKTSGK